MLRTVKHAEKIVDILFIRVVVAAEEEETDEGSEARSEGCWKVLLLLNLKVLMPFA